MTVILVVFSRKGLLFRSALTPLAVFSDTVKELLPNDGPEAVNATSLACTLGFDEVNFFGVDLGSADTEVERSKDAVAFTYRTWDIKEGNKDKTIHTNQAMLDVQTVLERTIQMYPKINFYNWSDGLRVKGACPIMSVDEYRKVTSIPQSNIDDNTSNHWMPITIDFLLIHLAVLNHLGKRKIYVKQRMKSVKS